MPLFVRWYFSFSEVQLYRCDPAFAGEVGTAMGLAVAGAACLILLPLRHQVAELFTDDEAVIEACSALMLPLAALLISEWC